VKLVVAIVDVEARRLAGKTGDEHVEPSAVIDIGKIACHIAVSLPHFSVAGT